MKVIEYAEIAWAEMKPYVYGGEQCDQIIPKWYGWFDGDMDGDYSDSFDLDAKGFPPGTKITISVPVCPNCQEKSDHSMFNNFPKEGTNFQELKCDCGFDWTNWTYDEYS